MSLACKPTKVDSVVDEDKHKNDKEDIVISTISHPIQLVGHLATIFGNTILIPNLNCQGATYIRGLTVLYHSVTHWGIEYCQTSNISRTLVGNKIAYYWDVLRASPVFAAQTTFSCIFSLYIKLKYGIVAKAFTMKCHRTSLIISQNCLKLWLDPVRHYLSQCWPRSLRHMASLAQWVNSVPPYVRKLYFILCTKWFVHQPHATGAFIAHQANAAGAFIVHQGNIMEHFGSYIM